MTNYSLSQIQQLEMKIHKVVDRIGRVEFENEKLKKQIEELKNASGK
jgi:FtsZ-binding cell division protein ZapB